MSTSRRSFLYRSLGAFGAAALRGSTAFASKKKSSKGGKKKGNGHDALFEDAFYHAHKDGWGWPWFNQRYQRSWSVRNGKAIYHLPATDLGMHYGPDPILVLDHDVANVDVRAIVATSNSTARIGLAARAVDYARYYAAYLGPGDVLRLVRCGHHGETVIAKRRISFLPETPYRLRFQVRGGERVVLRIKFWPWGLPEPTTWMIEETDVSAQALTTRGAFGVYTTHANDERPVTLRVWEFVARSKQQRSVSDPSISYSLAGVTNETGKAVRAVAHVAVPAIVDFEVGSEPSLTQSAARLSGGRTGRGGTARATIDLDRFEPGSTVYWRAVAERRGRRAVGPTSSFRVPPETSSAVRFAFGSCTRWQVSPRPSFLQARLALPDFFLHQGDFGYVLNHVPDHAADTYQDHWIRMLLDPHMKSLAQQSLCGLVQDDADYGVNQADRHNLREFTPGAFHDLVANPHRRYFETRYGDIALFSIDCRRYSTGKGMPLAERSKLGHEQKQWLRDRMRTAADDASVGLIVLASPQAFGSDASPASWRKHYTAEWEELIDLMQNLGAPVLICSGDAHGHRLHEYPQKNLDPNVPRIVEFVSSGTDHNKFSDFDDAAFVIKKAVSSGFGVVDLGPQRTVGENQVRDLALTAVRSENGLPYWDARYEIVHGVGIVPLI